MKKLTALLLALLLCFAAVGCANEQQKQPDDQQTTIGQNQDNTPAEKTPVRVAVLAGPTGMGAAKLMEDNAQKTAKNDYTFTVATAPDQVTAGLINGDFDIAAVPVNLASVLYNKTKGGVRLIGYNTLGVLYILENGESVKSLEDLRGKTLYATGQGSTPEYILNYLLEKAGLKVGQDVTVEYIAEHAELAAKLKDGSVSLGMLPEPQVSAAQVGNADLRVALNLTEEWNRVMPESTLIQGCLVARTAFLEEHSASVDAFLEEYAASADYAKNTPESAAPLMVKYGIIPKEPIALRAIPKANICCVTGETMKNDMTEMLSVLFAANPASIGGAMPDDAFYYVK